MFRNAAVSLLRLALVPTTCLLALAAGAGPALGQAGPAVPLTASVDANPAFATTIGWEVSKSADPTRQDVPPGGSATFNYVVSVTHDDGTDSNWQVSGQITVENPNTAPVDGVTVVDEIDDPGATCVSSGGSSTVPAGGTVVFDYLCTYSAAPASASETNTATVSWPEQTLANGELLAAGSTQAQAAVVWDEPTAVIDASVDVSDSRVGPLGTAFYTDPNPTEFGYSFTFDDAPGGVCTTYDNTATVSSDGVPVATDGASVEVCALEAVTIAATATPSFTRSFDWTIAKAVAGPTTVTQPPGSTATFDYTVDVGGDGTTDSGWALNGEITVTNTTDSPAVANVTDGVDNGGVCTVSGGTGVTIPSHGSVTLAYTCTYASAPTPAAGTHSATVTWDTFAFPAQHGSATVSTAFAFGAPTAEVNRTVSVTDTFDGVTEPLGTVAHPGPATFAYSRTVTVPDAGCVTHPNVATIEETGQTASAAVTVCAAAQPTCPPGQKVSFRWHYSANGTSGSWSGTKSTLCDGSTFTMGPQGMEGDLKLLPGTIMHAGYDFTIPGNKVTLTLTVNDPQLVLTLRCVSGATPTQPTLTVPMGTATYTVTNSKWYPSGDQHSPLVYQGAVPVPDVCAGGKVRFDKGGTFSAQLT